MEESSMTDQQMEAELNMVKKAFYPITEALLSNTKLAESIIGNWMEEDHSVAKNMVHIFEGISNYILNYVYVEKYVRHLQKQLKQSENIRRTLHESKMSIKDKLNELSQTTALNDVLSQLRIIFSDLGIAPGPLFKMENVDCAESKRNQEEEEPNIDVDRFEEDLIQTLYCFEPKQEKQHLCMDTLLDVLNTLPQ